MCLYEICHNKSIPKQIVGYKIMKKTKAGYTSWFETAVKHRYKIGEPKTAAFRILWTGNIFKHEPYICGFHVYSNKKDAMKWSGFIGVKGMTIVKVKLEDIHTVGRQDVNNKGFTYVGKKMTILEELK